MRKPCMLFALLFALPVFAHPPKGLEVEYDTDSSILRVEIAHSVNDASKHYVNKVVVEVNGKKVIEQTFRKQIDGETQQVMYKIIDAAEGDKISVTAYCNISGKKKADLMVTTAAAERTSE